MLKIGRGSPAIILEDGFGNGIEIQSSLQAALSEVSCVVAYDHAGTGGSDRGPAPRDARQTARELRIALANAGVPPPYILVGGSIGGDYCRVFVDEHPGDVAGLVLLDPTPDWDEMLQWAKINAPDRAENYRQLKVESEAAMHKLMLRQEFGRKAEWEQLSHTRRQAHDALPRLETPTIQLSGAAGRRYSSVADDKVRFFDAWLDEHIPHAEHVLASNSAHAVSITDQRLVVDQVRRLVKEVSDSAQPSN
jgi:pimeloyl-ACP methyl ester carboxylesterase